MHSFSYLGHWLILNDDVYDPPIAYYRIAFMTPMTGVRIQYNTPLYPVSQIKQLINDNNIFLTALKDIKILDEDTVLFLMHNIFESQNYRL